MDRKKDTCINGIRDGVPIAMGYCAVAFSLGIVAGNVLPESAASAMCVALYGMIVASWRLS